MPKANTDSSLDPVLRIAVHGAAGRMGQAILRLISARDDMCVVAALVRPGSDLLDQPLHTTRARAGLRVYYTTAQAASAKPSVLVDFSLPLAFDHVLASALEQRIALVSGTTGLGAEQHAAMAAAAATIPILWSANFSLGASVLAQLAAVAARAFPGWDCTIAESHHRAKKDAPSGTALALGRSVASARGQEFDAVANPNGVAPGDGGIGFAVTRAGDIVGEHTVLLAATGERIELTHRATNRDIFAHGAMTAAAWLAHRPAGIYTLADVLAGPSKF